MTTAAPNPEDNAAERDPKAPNPKKRRRGRDEGSVYWSEERQRWVAEVTLGYGANGKRRTKKRYSKTKTEATNKLKAMRKELDEGAVLKNEGVTVSAAVENWLTYGLNGKAQRTVDLYDYLARVHLIPDLGARKLKDLSADDVEEWLHSKAPDLATSTLKKLKSILERSLTRAQKRDQVRRNVVLLCDDVPTGRPGRKSKSLTYVQADSVLRAAESTPLFAYIVLSLLIGARPDELRGLRWNEVDLIGQPDASPPVPPSIKVWRTERAGGDTKTKKSRRTLALPTRAVEALKRHGEEQNILRGAYGLDWTDDDRVFETRTGTALDASHVRRDDDDRVFETRTGTALDASHVRRDFRRVAKAAGLEPRAWTPYELRHSFVSLLSDGGMPVEQISRLVGHSNSTVTEEVYRHQLSPVILEGAEAMDRLFPSENRDS